MWSQTQMMDLGGRQPEGLAAGVILGVGISFFVDVGWFYGYGVPC